MTVLLLSDPPAAASGPLTPEQQEQADIALILCSATQHHREKRFDDARALYGAILTAAPRHPDTHHNLGALEMQLGNFERGLQHFEIALGEQPNHPFYWLAYLHALIDAGHIAAAWTALSLCEQRGVTGPSIHTVIARLACSSEGKPAHLSWTPSEQKSDAETPARAPAKTREPSTQMLAATLEHYNAGRYAEACESVRPLTHRFPQSGATWRVYGLALHRSGRFREACAALEKAVACLPEDIAARHVLAGLLNNMGQPHAAAAQCRAVLERHPEYADAHRLLGLSLSAMGRTEEAIAAGKRALELAPQIAQMANSLAVILLDNGRMAEARDYFQQSLALDPGDAMTHSNLLFSLLHLPEYSLDALREAHRGFAERHEAPLKAHWPHHSNSRDPGRRLKIGFVSADLYQHAVTSYLLPVVEHLSRDPSLSLHFYDNYVREDHYTLRLRACAAEWHNVSQLNDAQFAALIADHGIDVLIDLSGHTGRNRLTAMARKPAPVQMSWIGYPGPSGLDAIDYYLADRFFVPFGETARLFTEKIIHLPAIAPFVAASNAPPVSILPALHNHALTFGSFNRHNKLRPEVIALWSQILRQLPNARMVIGATKDGSEARLRSWFDAAGIAPERIRFVPNSGIVVYLQQHHQIDVCLDTFPYSASTTTLNALWMGVPTLTLTGATPCARGSATWMSHVGLERFVASDPADFVARGVALAADIPALAATRATLRERCLASAVFRSEQVAAGLSNALRTAWTRWCEGLPPASFAVPEAALETCPPTAMPVPV